MELLRRILTYLITTRRLLIYKLTKIGPKWLSWGTSDATKIPRFEEKRIFCVLSMAEIEKDQVPEAVIYDLLYQRR